MLMPADLPYTAPVMFSCPFPEIQIPSVFCRSANTARPAYGPDVGAVSVKAPLPSPAAERYACVGFLGGFAAQKFSIDVAVAGELAGHTTAPAAEWQAR